MNPDMEEKDWTAVVARVRGTDRPDVERLALAFDWITRRCLETGRREIELLCALEDRESRQKAQVKVSVMEHCRVIFQRAHLLATGRPAWSEERP